MHLLGVLKILSDFAAYCALNFFTVNHLGAMQASFF